jgi:hypothetical protein
MSDDTIAIANARNEIERLSCQLRELRLEEERCRLRRARLEAERARVQMFVDTCELARRFNKPAAQPSDGATFQIVPLDKSKPDGVKVVTVAAQKSAVAVLGEPSAKHKPANMPTLKTMVATAFEGHTELKTDQIFAFVRRRWWPSAPRNRVRSTIWKMCATGQLEKDAGAYKLNGHW